MASVTVPPDPSSQSIGSSSTATSSQNPGQAQIQVQAQAQANSVPVPVPVPSPSGASTGNPQQPHQAQQNVTPQTTPTPRASDTQPEEWVPRRLKWWWLTICFFLNIAIIVVILTLIQVSAKNHGIATVPRPSNNVNSLSISSLWQYGLLWTSLPSLFLALFALMWTSIVAATADRQPFVELRRPQSRRANAKVTIMLDYRVYSAFTRWFHAFRNGHIVLGCAMIISVILNLVTVPLASHMMAAVDSQHQRTVLINYLTSFEDSLDIVSRSLQPAIDLATAILVYGGTTPTWMMPQQAFIGFSEAKSPSVGNLTAFTSAYSGYLDCQVLNSSNYQISSDSAILSVDDRGCSFQKTIFISGPSPYYLYVWYNHCVGQYSRIGLVSGIYSASSPHNLSSLSVISCVPSYWHITGELTVLTAPRASPALQRFAPNSSVEMFSVFTSVIETHLPEYALFEPSDEFDTNAAGFAVYQIAASRDSASPFNSTLLKDSLEQFYNTFYASLLVDYLIKPASNAGNGSATLSVQVTRLYMINAISYVVCGFLVVLGTCTVWLFVYTLRHPSMLCEEPVGLLGVEAITQDSGLSSFFSTFKQQHPTESKPCGFIKSNYTIGESKCYYLPDDPGTGGTHHGTVPKGQIRIDSLKPKV